MRWTKGLGADAFVTRALLVLVLGFPSVANGFVILDPETNSLESAVRWAAAPSPAVGSAGLYDGIQVAAEPDLAEKLAMAVTGGAAANDVADAEAALRAAFAAWESGALRFEIEFDGPAERGDGGAEIDVFAVPESDPVFQNNDFFGRTRSSFELTDDRLLTNGTVLPGFAFVASDIFLNLDMLAAISGVFTREQQPAALQRLVMHEAGHALGFGHPNVFVEFNYDTDFDPLNPMPIDPNDPLGNLMLSPNVNENAVMSNLPNSFDALLLTELSNDEIGGRDALYPAPPLSTCIADCDANGAVTVDELVLAIDIGRGQSYFLACPAADRDRNLRVTIDEMVAAVSRALFGCEASTGLVVDVARLAPALEDPAIHIVHSRAP